LKCWIRDKWSIATGYLPNDLLRAGSTFVGKHTVSVQRTHKQVIEIAVFEQGPEPAHHVIAQLAVTSCDLRCELGSPVDKDDDVVKVETSERVAATAGSVIQR
jgi:hypothetical protein